MSKKKQGRVEEVNIEDIEIFGFGDDLPASHFELNELPVTGDAGNRIEPVEFGSYQLMRVPLSLIRDNPHQYRQEITPESVGDLVEQFRERGLENALEQFPKATVRSENGQSVYVLVSGHRRRAAWSIAFPNEAMPLAVKSGITDRDLIFGGLVENLSRMNVSEVEAARGMQALLDTDPHMSHRKLAQLLKKNQSTLSRMFQLLALPLSLQEENREGRLNLRTGVALVRFIGLPGAAEYAYQQITAAGLTAEEVEKRGWELLRGWAGWETNPMPAEAAEVLLPKVTNYYSAGTLASVSNQAQASEEYTIQATGTGYGTFQQSNRPTFQNYSQSEPFELATLPKSIFTVVPPASTKPEEIAEYEITEKFGATTPSRPVFTVLPPASTKPEEIAEYEVVVPASSTLPETTPYEVAEIAIEKPVSQPFTMRRATNNYEKVNEFLWKLKSLHKAGQQVEPMSPTLHLALALVVGLAITNGETEVVKKVISHRWKQLGGETPYPTQADMQNCWKWTQPLSIETLALLAGELVVAQWKWEQDSFPKLEDIHTLGWLEEFLKTLP